MSGPLRIGSRASPLARAQLASVLRGLKRSHPGLRVELVLIDSAGDRDRSATGSPDFTSTLQQALRRGRIDLAVHSAKDLPAREPADLRVLAYPARADPRDCLVLAPGLSARRVPRGARIGSSSLRRQAQLRRWRPDLRIVQIRGNVGTRIGYTRSGRVDGVILAVAGIRRLGRAAEISRVLSPRSFLPAPAQGSLALEGRREDRSTRRWLGALDHAPSRARAEAERALAEALGGDCNLPLGALARWRGSKLVLDAEVLSEDGAIRIAGQERGPPNAGRRLGARLGERMLAGGAGTLLRRAAVPGE